MTVRLTRPITVRRMESGALAVFVGEDMISGLSSAAIVDDGNNSVLTLQFYMQAVHLDTEKAEADKLN